MNKKIFNNINKIVTLILLIVSILTVIPAKVAQGVLKNRSYSNNSYNKDLELSKNVSFSGVYDSYSWNFNIYKRTNIKDIKTSMVFEVTDVLEKNIGSYLTFLVNGTEFYSKKIESNNGQNQTIELKLPLELLKDGFNEIKVEGYLRLTDMPCTDDLNTANWLVLKKESKVNITQTNMIPENLISELTYPLVNMGGYEITKIVIPDSYTDGELTSALKMQGLIAREGGKGQIIKAENGKALEKSNIAYIGRTDAMPEIFKKGIGGFEDLNNQAYINIANSPVGATGQEKILYILSENDKELICAVKFLMNKELVSQVNKSSVYINSKMDLNDKIKEPQKTFTFKELGYNQKTVEGLFRNEMAINYSLPQNRQLSVGDTININFRYSENLDFDRSLFTVFINDIPVASKKLEKEKANEDNLLITVPEDVTNIFFVEIKFAFDLLLNDVNCEIRDQKQPWVFVRDDSTIQINNKELKQFYFDTYPAPFVSDWDMNETLFVLPDNLSSSELTALGNMSAYMEKQTKYNLGSLEAISSKNLENQHNDKNIVVYGTPDNNKLIKELNKNLWMQYNNEYTKFESNEKLTLMDDFSKTISTFQLDKSPYNSQRNMLVLTSPRADLLEKSLLFLSEDKEFYKLNGDGAVIDEHGNVRCFKYKEEVEAPSYDKIIKLSSSSKILLVVLLALVTFTISAILLYKKKYKIKVFRKNNKSK